MFTKIDCGLVRIKGYLHGSSQLYAYYMYMSRKEIHGCLQFQEGYLDGSQGGRPVPKGDAH